MTRKLFRMMLIASMTLLTACSQDNLEEYYNNWNKYIRDISNHQSNNNTEFMDFYFKYT